MDLKAHPAIEIQIWINKIITITNVVQFCIGPPAFGLFSVRFLSKAVRSVHVLNEIDEYMNQGGGSFFIPTSGTPECNLRITKNYCGSTSDAMIFFIRPFFLDQRKNSHFCYSKNNLE